MLSLEIGPRVAARTAPGFDDRPYERFAVQPLSPTIGAEISGVHLGDPVDDELHAELRRALLEWKVLFFRDQDITRDQQRDFALRWGPLEQHPFYAFVHPGNDDADVVTLAKDATSGGAENEWHADVTWHSTPSWGAVLRAVEVPPVGGDTLWADAAAAHDALPEELRERIADMTAVHDWQHTFGLAMEDADRERLAEQFPAPEHPVVRIHPETGRRTLFVNAIFTTRIVGLPEDESDALLRRLTRELSRPEHQCRFRWTPGAVAFWDNRATQHYAASDYWPQRRVMDRISIAGDVPVGPT
ncbi:taurine dioxygenase [Iamia sp. SCSIO 61187]|uniref:TauD/TfdA dioxygenase family protein n=1 Tax=Iamia sp. SCSIO 61187 TaxID=2722752 RepID=UPI001C634A71|nr:TauD/TfdA family dioxygenase [Iamia sp. SCSIO 61187]QYG95108.1 taurine dioxygenase [Iamia sp. SCSIO 61187]